MIQLININSGLPRIDVLKSHESVEIHHDLGNLYGSKKSNEIFCDMLSYGNGVLIAPIMDFTIREIQRICKQEINV